MRDAFRPGASVVAVAIACASACATAFGTRIARADDVQAEALYQEGRRAAAGRDWQRACAAFEASQAREAAPGTLLNLADSEEHAGRLGEAARHYEDAARLFRKGDARIAYALGRASDVRGRLQAESARPVSDAAAVTPWSALAEETSPPIRPPISVPQPSSGQDVRWSALRIGALASVSVGTVGLATGIAAGLMTLHAKGVVDRECHPDCPASAMPVQAEGRTASVASSIGFAASVAGAGLGVGLWFAGSRRSETKSPPRASLVVGAAPDGVGVRWVGTF